MYYPSTRLLSILDLLRAHGQMKATDLAAQLEVDVRTVRRYISMLQDMGMPVETERGRHGGYRLRPGYKLPPLVLAEGEVLTLTLGLLVAQRMGFTHGTEPIDVTVAKLDRVVPSALREAMETVNEALITRLPLPYVPVDSNTVLTLSTAVYQQRRVSLRYTSRSGRETERLLDPYGVVYTIGLWYVAGYCHLRQDLRTFRVDRITGVELCEEGFERPESFETLEFVESSIARTPGVWRAEVLLHVDMEEARRIIPSSMAILTPDAHGTKMHCYVSDLERLARFLLGLECGVVVRHPPQLRDALRALAQKALRLAEGAATTIQD